MPHYRSGLQAKIGDHVTGKGYNVKDTISGVVVGIVEGSESCNIRVAYLSAAKVHPAHETDPYAKSKPTGHTIDNRGACVVIDSVPLNVQMEYGDTKGFELTDSPGGGLAI